jgi:hypothetical protein
MSLYRQPGRTAARTLAAIAVVAALAGGAIGYALGSGGDDGGDASLADAVAALRSDMAPVRNGLELVPTEYRQGVNDGRVVSEPEYGAAKAAAQRAREVLLSHERDLLALAPERAATLHATIESLAAAVDQRESAADVETLARRASSQLTALLG